jgi:hypothetical protein
VINLVSWGTGDLSGELVIYLVIDLVIYLVIS